MNRLLKFFAYAHLPEGKPREMSILFAQLANTVDQETRIGSEQTVALRKLLEAKDAAVRAVIYPGG